LSIQGERLKDIRFVLRLSQKQMAEKLGIKSQSISKVESDSGNFSIDVYVKLVELFNVNLNWLLAGNGEMFISTEKNENFDQKVELKVTELLDRYGLTDQIK
jgi:transcriptional regulator with XRE-family HTH domain